MRQAQYDRAAVVAYARSWAYGRNPRYYNFDRIGGDCTNFVSQCLYAGSRVMNHKGWYYYSLADRAPSWTGVEFLYDFLTGNRGAGPFAQEAGPEDMSVGDLVQLSHDGASFGHSAILVDIERPRSLSGMRVAAHTGDVFGKALSDYIYRRIRFLRIAGVRLPGEAPTSPPP